MAKIHKQASRLAEQLKRIVSSERFFIITLLVFAIESAWVAVSSIYPMAFDEDTHLTKINYYAHHFNSFFATQPTSLDNVGAVVHDPSYLYHLIMALPWRLVTLISSNFTTQIILMRFLNIGLFILALMVFRKVLLKALPNKAIVNLSLFFVALTPLIVQLAGQINYDNLLILLLSINLLLLINIYEKLKADKIDVWPIGLFLALGTLTNLVKYTFLPIFIVMVGFLIWRLFVFASAKNHSFFEILKKQFSSLKSIKKFTVVLFILLSFVLVFERYGLNLARYHSATPSCVQVLGEQRCKSYSIYERGQIYAANKPAYYNKNPVYYFYLWLKHMLFNLMMTINGPVSGYSIGQPLPLPYLTLLTMFCTGTILCLIYWRKIFTNPVNLLFGLIIAVYLLPLFVLNYSDYLKVGRRVAVQGRYLAPLLPLLFFLFILALSQLLKRWANFRVALASLAVLFFLLGGGAITFILHSDQAWYWPNNNSVLSLNKNAQNILRPIILSSKYTPYWQSSLEF